LREDRATAPIHPLEPATIEILKSVFPGYSGRSRISVV